MSTGIELSILIATVGERAERFLGLLLELLSQIEEYDGKIEIVAYWNNYERPLAEIRQELVNQARGKYVCFIDDDDDVPEYYCERIIDNLGKDYVGWHMQLFHNGLKMKPTFHSIRYTNWSEDENGYYRNISHLNPIKRSIALKVPFQAEPGIPEDATWAQRVAPLVKSENYIEDVMYFYIHSTEDSVWRGKPVQEYERPAIRHPYFRYISKES